MLQYIIQNYLRPILFSGYYRINYDSNNWLLLVEQLQEDHRKIHVLNRAQLIDDSFSLATDERIKYDIPFCLGTYLDNETEMLPLYSALKKFHYIYSQYETTNVGPRLKVNNGPRNCTYEVQPPTTTTSYLNHVHLYGRNT